MSLEKLIEEYGKIVEAKEAEVQDSKERLQLLKVLQAIKEKRLRGEKLTEDDIRKAMEVTCFNSIAHCCKYTKGCPWFFSACDALGLNPKEVSLWKEETTWKWLKETLGVES